jgi:hypothetical protein
MVEGSLIGVHLGRTQPSLATRCVSRKSTQSATDGFALPGFHLPQRGLQVNLFWSAHEPTPPCSGTMALIFRRPCPEDHNGPK